MAESKPLAITPPPGVVLTESSRVAEGRYIASRNVRFVKGKPQKLGGNIRITSTPTDGQPRASHAWRDNVQNSYFAIGTYKKLYAYDPSWAQSDITPYRSEGSLGTDPFTVTDGSTTITVHDVGHGGSPGDIVYFSGATAVGDITISGAYTIDTVIDADHYTIIHSTAASTGNDAFTEVLLHFDGVDGSTTITDSNAGGFAHTWTANGNAQIDTADSVFGGASGLFDGVGDYVTTPDHADFNLGSTDFTIDCRFKIAPADAGGVQLLLAGQMDSAATAASISFYIERTSGNAIQVVLCIGAGGFTVASLGSYTGSTNPGWHHCAVTRSGTSLRLFIDGVLQNTTFMAGTVNNSTNALSVGRGGEVVGATWRGWIDEFRLSRGIARWTANFTPPTSAYVTSPASGGGAAVTYKYEIPIGVELGAYGLGYGVGGYGLGTYGTAREDSTIFIEPRVWSLDHFGKLLMASYNGGSIYKFDPTDAQPWPRAVIISSDPGLPTQVRAMFVTPERFIFALCIDMQVAWCTQGDYTIWTPATGNTANIRTLTEGTKLVGGKVLSDFISLVWTDAALYRFQYTGSTYVYNSSMIAKDCGLVSPNAAITAGGVGYWMGQDTFWQFAGAVAPMPNVEDIRKYIYDLVDIASGYQCNTTFWPQHNEVAFFITIEGETTPTIGVLYSIENQCWAPLDFGRCSGAHFTQGDTRPYMAASDGYLYQHENTNDDNGVAMPWSLQLAPYAMNEGGEHMDVEYITGDFKDQVGDITVTVDTYDYLNDSTFEDTETDTLAPTDSGPLDMRVSGRYIGLLLSCDSLGCYFRMGKPVAWIKPSGRR